MKTHLGHYEIVEELGRGGMGVVYKGFEPALSRFVAIKELSPSLAHDANLVERFLREARSMAALNDPHIIQIYFIGTDEATGQPFFAMEFVEGDSLSGVLKRDGKLSVENSLKVLHQTAQGLATAHDKGVIHRDIKPGNLMITSRGNVKIADFGIALATQDFSKKLTSTGEFVGTPGYLSPEVCTGKTVDRRSDIFSLGIVLYEMLSGESPFHDESPLGLMLEVVKAEIPDIRQINSEVDADTAAILTRMLAKDPADRFQSCHELAAALEKHALVAKGGTIRLAIAKPAPNDATLVGAPTPGSQPLRAATPPPVVGRTGSASAPVAPPTPPPSAPEAARMPSPPPNAPAARRGGAGKAIAIAAVLLVLVGVAVAFGGRDLLRGVREGVADARSATADRGTSDSTVTASEAATTSTTAQPATPAATTGDVLAAAAMMPTSTADAAVAAPAGVQAAEPLERSATAAVEPTSNDESALSATVAAAEPAHDADGAVFASHDAEPARPLKALREARQSVASVAPPRPAAEKPAALPPRIAVVALGDPALASPVRATIEQRLAAAGHDVVDASLFVDSRDDLPRVFAALQREATVAVVIRTEHLGQRELNFYGRSETQYSANLIVRAYRIDGRQPLGPGFTEQVEFTGLNARDNAGLALEKHLDRVLGELSPYRRRG